MRLLLQSPDKLSIVYINQGNYNSRAYLNIYYSSFTNNLFNLSIVDEMQ